MNRSALWLLTGLSGAGKTTFCGHLAQYARQHSWDVAGLLSTPWADADNKIGIRIEDLHSKERRSLAYGQSNPLANLNFGPWHFDEQVFQWGNQIIKNCTPCDLLIVDELGPLEFNVGKGLLSAFDIIVTGNYQVGVVVIRPSLLSQACARWPWAKPLPIADATIQKLLPSRHTIP